MLLGVSVYTGVSRLFILFKILKNHTEQREAKDFIQQQTDQLDSKRALGSEWGALRSHSLLPKVSFSFQKEGVLFAKGKLEQT